MTNWHALPHELKYMIFNYYIENAVNDSVSEDLESRTAQDYRQSLKRHGGGLVTLLLIYPEFEQEAMRSLNARLQKLCDVYNEEVRKRRKGLCISNWQVPYVGSCFPMLRELVVRIMWIEGWLLNLKPTGFTA